MDLQTDYFRAADQAAVQKVMARGDRPAAESFESVRTKGVDPTVALPHLVVALRGEGTPVKDGPDRSVWPTGLQPWHPEAPAKAVDFEDPWMTGPWVVELPDETRDTLAGIDRKRLPQLTTLWGRTDEMKGVERVELMRLIHQLGVLARRAKQDGQHLYCSLTA
ncbi:MULTISPECIES: hypothetical protein [Kitasatospora]|uniref:Uncharacterized protein n=1 Tax=Kitasatospora setae (strain ATCC 33774 / DSM 43861 / JCM 3304 / KCC A-0304 / NBRC 14216 / KM-6054) TaxID=452652 RepID=E4N186_KITSK|nr:MULTISPECIES: hypothetical protein [Kitasatospora]BAJ31920.1 hypothetical protein KSE_61540 [Kitasatospora setae KM-6054]